MRAKGRKSARTRLRRSLPTEQRILESITDAFFALDLSWRFVYLNRQAEHLLQRRRSDLLGKNIWEEFSDRIGSTSYQQYHAAMAAGITVHFEEFYPSLKTWFEVHAFPYPEGLAVYFRDINERKQAEDTLRQRESTLRMLIEQMPAVLWATDTDLRFTLSLGAGLAALGLRPNQVVGMTLNEFLGTSDPTLLPIAAHQRALHGESVTYDFVWQGRTFHTHVEPLTNAEGRTAGVIGVAFDMTDRKRAEEEAQRRHQELRILSHRLVHVQETERRHLARELHDEVGQVLTGLKLTLEMIARGPVERVGVSLGEVQRLVNQLMAQVRRLSLDLRPAMLDDLGLLPALLWHLERYTAQTNIHVTFTHHGVERRFPPEIETAAYRIIQEALTNVARHASVAEVTVRVWAGPESLGMQIEDKGQGFDPEAVRVERDCSGLSGMHERVTLLGGHLAVESRPHHGTQLTAELPLNRRAEDGRRDEPWA
jgi:PAS domain S-box-containing protein